MNKSGHIIIELLLSIVVFAIIMLIILQIIVMLKAEVNLSQSNTDNLLLVKRAQNDLEFCKEIESLEPFTCELYNREKLKYELTNQDLVRSINNKGYEVVASGVDQITVTGENPLTVEIQKSKKKTTVVIGVENE